jgi:hypothetical protein
MGILITLAVIMAFSSNRFTQNELKKSSAKKVTATITPDKNIFREAFQNKIPDRKDTIITLNPNNNVEYQVNGNKYVMNFNDSLKLISLTLNNKEIPQKDWKKYEKTVDEVIMLKKNVEKGVPEDKSYNLQIVKEIVQEMKNEGIIDKDAISYKAYFYNDYIEINGKRQPDEIFSKYMKMYMEKSGGRRDWNVQLNVNPNFYGKSPLEILKIQQEFIDKQAQENRMKSKELMMQEQQLKLQKLEFENLYANRELNEKQQEFMAKQEKKLQEQEEQLKKQKQILEQQEQTLKSQQEEIQKKQQQAEKQYQELIMQNEQLKKQNEELKKQNEQLLKEKK